MNRAFVGLGSNAERPRERLERALSRLEEEGVRVAAVAPPVSGPFLGPDGRPMAGAPAVLNTVAEVGTALEPEELLACLLALETEAGRERGGTAVRTLDLDLLSHGDAVRSTRDLVLPHPRATQRAFVLGPWAAIAPQSVPAGKGDNVGVHAARLEAREPRAFSVLRREPELALPDLRTLAEVVRAREDLDEWLGGFETVSLVPTMGALHAGHAALVRRARAAGDAVLASIFVNPLQFGPAEDLARYPRTLDADLALLAAAGADGVYVPDAADLYPPGFSMHVVPEGPARGFEGDLRPGHFRGVATVVLKLFERVRPHRAWFGQKDAQQAAVVKRLVRDLDLHVDLEIAPTVRDADGLALSSRNRYLTSEERVRARAFPEALAEVARAAARGEREAVRLLEPARARLTAAGLPIDYLALVDPDAFTPLERLGQAPALVVAAVRAGTTRLLDNRWVVVP